MNVLLFCNSVPSVQGILYLMFHANHFYRHRTNVYQPAKRLCHPSMQLIKHMFATFLRGNNSQCNKDKTTGRDTEYRKTVIKEINSKHNKSRVVISSNK